MQTSLLHLSLIEGIGDTTIHHILSHNIDLEQLYRMSAYDLQQRFGIMPKKAEIIAAGLRDTLLLEQELRLLEKHPVNIVTVLDDLYPALLRHISVPPAVLYYQGDITQLDRSIAIVGARKANYYAKNVMQQLVPGLVQAGFAIVSGGALGVDTLAHQETIACGGRTVAVLGSGLLNPYPLSNKKLFEQIVHHGGALVSAFPLLMEPLAGNFPARNRIISGLSNGVIVVQAAAKSGALITAHYAIEQNRDVFAVPGAINDPLSEGCHNLIKQGAGLATSAQDVLQDYKIISVAQAHNVQKQHSLFDAIEEEDPLLMHCITPRSLDELAQLTNLDATILQIKLFDLQLEGKIEQDFAGLWHRI